MDSKVGAAREVNVAEYSVGRWRSRLDMTKTADALLTKRQGKVRATGGCFGAVQLAVDVQACSWRI